jgi:mannan endo-1,6-alpha-mannosidase
MLVTQARCSTLFSPVFILTGIDSIKSAAKTLASGIVASYNESLAQNLIPGLFDDTYYWWESANVFTELIEYSYLTDDSQYNGLISEALQHQLGDFDAFMPPNQTKTLSNDAQSFWGLASLTAHEAGLPKPAGGEWLDFAANVWNIQVQRWDAETCDGGLRWQIFTFNNGYGYRNSISNGNFFLLSSRLAYLTGNTTYYDWASKSYAWSKEVGLVSDDYFVFDGTDDHLNCTTVNHIQWSNNHAIYTEGSALMYNMVSPSRLRYCISADPRRPMVPKLGPTLHVVT